MLNVHPIRSTIKDADRYKLHLAFCALLVRAFPDRSLEILVWRIILSLKKSSWVPRKAPPCARIAWRNPTRSERLEWCPDLKCSNVRIFAVAEFMRGLIGANCGIEDPMRILKEAIFCDVDPWPIFLYLARENTGQDYREKAAAKKTGRPRGSKNKKPGDVLELDSFRPRADPLKVAA